MIQTFFVLKKKTKKKRESRFPFWLVIWIEIEMKNDSKFTNFRVGKILTQTGYSIGNSKIINWDKKNDIIGS